MRALSLRIRIATTRLAAQHADRSRTAFCVSQTPQKAGFTFASVFLIPIALKAGPHTVYFAKL